MSNPFAFSTRVKRRAFPCCTVRLTSGNGCCGNEVGQRHAQKSGRGGQALWKVNIASRNRTAGLPNSPSVQEEIPMSASTTTMTSSSTSVYTTPAFWERLWRTGGIQSIFCFVVAYLVYGHQPQVGASPDALAAFYDGERTRILIAAVVCGFAILN